jgi:hypothetical protein
MSVFDKTSARINELAEERNAARDQVRELEAENRRLRKKLKLSKEAFAEATVGLNDAVEAAERKGELAIELGVRLGIVDACAAICKLCRQGVDATCPPGDSAWTHPDGAGLCRATEIRRIDPAGVVGRWQELAAKLEWQPDIDKLLDRGE